MKDYEAPNFESVNLAPEERIAADCDSEFVRSEITGPAMFGVALAAGCARIVEMTANDS